jgi:hypothetical protein
VEAAPVIVDDPAEGVSWLVFQRLNTWHIRKI